MSVVDDVKARLDIVDVVSGYVNLQKAGRNFKALCPFHHERTPSFVVFPDTQTWRCFGACSEGGDIFGFVMKAEGWDFRDTLQELAKRAGVELVPATPQQLENEAETERLLGLLHETARFFHEQLLESPQAQIARDYVTRRRLDASTVESFMVGYAPDDWRQALHHLQMLGYTQDEIVAAGVAIRGENDSIYDRFRHRLVIPIRDGRGRTIGFGARALDADAKPKYLNSPQSVLFDKSHVLFGLDMARRTIRETETVVIVEGYMDVMQAHQAGFCNVVAQMGTALTEHHLRQLDRYATRLILALDPDAAGMNATMRGLDVARQTLDEDQIVTFDPRGMMRYTGMLNMDVRVASLPGGQDPDELIQDDPAAWETLIDGAIPVADYVIRQGTANLGPQASYHEREAAARELLPILTATENDLQRSGNIQALARRVRIDERTLIQWTQRRQAAQKRAVPSLSEQRKLAGRPAAPSQRRSERASGPPGQSAAREGFCLLLLLQEPERLFAANRTLRELQQSGPPESLRQVLGPFGAEDFSRPEYQAIYRELERALYRDDVDPLDHLRQHLPEEVMAVVSETLTTPLEVFQQESPRWIVELESIQREQKRANTIPEPNTGLFLREVLALRHSRLEREGRELYFLQRDAQANGDDLTGIPYQETITANKCARQLLARTLQQMRSFARDV